MTTADLLAIIITTPIRQMTKRNPNLKKLVGLCVFSALLVSYGCSGKAKEDLFAQGLSQLKNNDPGGAIVYFKNSLEKDEDYLDARYQLAMAYVKVAKYDHAEKEFKTIQAQDPTRHEIKLELARVYNLTNRPELAIKECQEFINLAGESIDAQEVLGIAYAIANQPVEAEKYLRLALQREPARTSARLQLAALLITLNKQDEARKLLDEVIKVDTHDARAYYLQAGLEVSLGYRDRAVAIYRHIHDQDNKDSLSLYKAGILQVEMSELEKAWKTANELVQLFPKRSDGYRLRGIVHYYKKDYREAINELQRSLSAQPNTEAYYFLGLSLYAREELENALSNFNIILNNNQNFVRARLLSGIILLRQNRVNEAIIQMQKLVHQSPRFALARNILGSAYMAKGLYDEGMHEFNASIELDPSLVDTYLKKGIFYLNRGLGKEAETDLQTAVRIAPEILKTRMILASYYMRQKDFPKALQLLQAGVSGKKDDAPLYNYMASIAMTQKKQAECQRCLQKAKEADPEFYPAYFNLALYYAAEGKTDAAFNEYRLVLRKDPRNVKAQLSIAALFELNGREQEAYAQYQKALETKSEEAYLALAYYHLKKQESAKALEVLTKAYMVLPRNATILENKGRVLLAEKQYREAIEVFNDLESITQDRGLPFKIKAYVLMGDYDRAEDQARRIISLRPTSAYGYLTLASIYEYRNDLGRAIGELRQGLQVERGNLQARLVLGNLYARNRDGVSAMAAYEEVLRINPDFAPAIFYQGVLFESQGNKEEAIKKYQFALSKDESYVPALNNLAYLYVDGHGNVQEGLRLALAGFKLDLENPGVMDTLGYALLKNGRLGYARNILERAVELLPNNPTVAYHLALVYKESAARDRAVAILEKALTLGGFPEAADASRLLQELRN